CFVIFIVFIILAASFLFYFVSFFSIFFFFSSRRRHTRSKRDWSSDVCSSDLNRLLHSIVGLRGYAVNSHRRREVISSEPPARTGPASAPSRSAPAPSRPETAPSLREHALVVIGHAITTGDLDEQTIYSAAGLAKQLGISLSPVREAMMSRVAEGTVEAVPNRGFRLVPVTREDLEEIVHIRALLAGPAVESLCARAVEDPKRLAPQL